MSARYNAGPIQFFASAGNGWPHNALRYHWLMPISCNFRGRKALLDTSLTHVSSACNFYLSCGLIASGQGLAGKLGASDCMHVLWSDSRALNTSEYWFGLHKLSATIDGTTAWYDGNPSTYRNWATGEPSNATACILYSKYGFRDQWCSMNHYYTCKKSPGSYLYFFSSCCRTSLQTRAGSRYRFRIGITDPPLLHTPWSMNKHRFYIHDNDGESGPILIILSPLRFQINCGRLYSKTCDPGGGVRLLQ